MSEEATEVAEAPASTFPVFPVERFTADPDNETAVMLGNLIATKHWPQAQEAYEAMGQVRNAREEAKKVVDSSDAPQAQQYRADKAQYEKNKAKYEAEKAKAKEVYDTALNALEERFVKPENGLKNQKLSVEAKFKAAVEVVAAEAVAKMDTKSLADKFEAKRVTIASLLKSIESTGVKVDGIRLPTSAQAVSGRKAGTVSSSGNKRGWTPRFTDLTVTKPDGSTVKVDPATVGAAAKIIGATRQATIDRLVAQLGAEQFTDATVKANNGTISWKVNFNENDYVVSGSPDPKQIVGGAEEDTSEEDAA